VVGKEIAVKKYVVRLLNIQLRLDFSSAPTGEARQAGREDIESHSGGARTARVCVVHARTVLRHG
jgi:hypothetical protein